MSRFGEKIGDSPVIHVLFRPGWDSWALQNCRIEEPATSVSRRRGSWFYDYLASTVPYSRSQNVARDLRWPLCAKALALHFAICFLPGPCAPSFRKSVHLQRPGYAVVRRVSLWIINFLLSALSVLLPANTILLNAKNCPSLCVKINNAVKKQRISRNWYTREEFLISI